MTARDRVELIGLVEKTLGPEHPTAKRVIDLLDNGHDRLAQVALRETVAGRRALIEMDEDGLDSLSEETTLESREEERQDLKSLEMLLEAIGG